MNRFVPVFIALLLIIDKSLVVNAAAIMCKFSIDEFGRYTAVIEEQSYDSSDLSPKVYGRHLPGKKNSDVRVIDCAYKNNKFESFPATLTQIFANTEVLMLQNSGLQELSFDSFKFTSRVKIMMFARDNFIIEPSVFKGCLSLEVLKFEEIDFTNTDEDAFDGTDDLKILSMKNCTFNAANFKFLEPISSLSELYLTESSINIPPLNAIKNMPLLKILDLSGNNLTYLHNDLVENKHFLELLDLSNNEIREIERTILEIWPNNAALSLEGNKCINRNFGHLGTSDLPLFDVVVHFMDCFHHSDDDEATTKNSNESSAEGEEEEEEGEEEEEENGGSESLEKQHSASDEKSHEFGSSVESSSDENGISKEVENKMEEIEEKKEEEVVGTGSPFEFANVTESTSSSSEGSDEDESNENTTTEEATTTTTTTTEQPTTTTLEEATTKKKKNKKSKKKGGEVIEAAVTEMPTTEEIQSPITGTIEEIEIESKDETETTSSYLHPYEQATCRFFIDADKGCNCVLENVTPEIRKINTDRSHECDHQNITGLYLRDSTLIKIPHLFFTTFPNLLHLSIEETNLKQLDDDTLKDGCGSLKTLSLKKNRIRVVDAESLKTCIALELIDLSFNPVERIEGGIFECNPNLNVVLGSLTITAAHLP